jgi:hypothetical protein
MAIMQGNETHEQAHAREMQEEGRESDRMVAAGLVEFEEMLKAHDWTYAFSDDHRVFKRGEAQRLTISEQYHWLRSVGRAAEANGLYESYYCRAFRKVA